MNGLRNLDPDDVAAVAEAALTSAMGGTVRIRDIEALSGGERRNLILRGKAIREGRGDRPVVIKASRSASYDPIAATAFVDSGLVKEWAATAFLAARAPGRENCAALLAGDPARGVLVFEDLGAGLGSLVERCCVAAPRRPNERWPPTRRRSAGSMPTRSLALTSMRARCRPPSR